MHDRTFLTMAAIGALMPAVAGCVENAGLLAVTAALIPDESANSCVAAPSTGTHTISQGVLDLDVYRDSVQTPPPYVLWPLIQNNLNATATDKAPNEINSFVIQGANVKLSLPGWTLSSSAGCDGVSFQTAGTTTIPPAGAFGTLALEVIKPCQGAQLRAQMAEGQEGTVWIDMAVFGKAGGGSMHSDTFSFPVKVCRGCLQLGIPAPYAECNYYTTLCQCSEIAKNPAKGWSCNVGQDYGPILCCLASDGTTTICPAPGTDVN